MKKRGNPALLGLFVVAGLVLVFITLFSIAGGELFTRKERVVMYFGGSIYGLQVGAPVVFRGVRLGSVTTIGLTQDKARGDVALRSQSRRRRRAMSRSNSRPKAAA